MPAFLTKAATAFPVGVPKVLQRRLDRVDRGQVDREPGIVHGPHGIEERVADRGGPSFIAV